MRQLFALQQRQCDNKIEHQGQEKIWKILRPHCLNGVDTSNIDIWDELKTWSRCRGSAVAWPALEKEEQVFFIVFLSANETYFICKGEHCLQTWKDDRKIFNNLAGKPGRIFARQRAKYSKSWWLNDTIGEKTDFFPEMLQGVSKISFHFLKY